MFLPPPSRPPASGPFILGFQTTRGDLRAFRPGRGEGRGTRRLWAVEARKGRVPEQSWAMSCPGLTGF